jgi:quinol-cytochrome oxidoreductase complex cytochrome b subunit
MKKRNQWAQQSKKTFLNSIDEEISRLNTAKGIFWMLLVDCLLLGWIGCQPVEAPFVTIGQISPFVFFLSGSKTLGLD